MPVDNEDLGEELVRLLSESLKDNSVDCLKKLARAWQSLADERSIGLEVFLLHKFLLVQACTGMLSAADAPPSVINRVVAVFYESLDVVLAADIDPPLYVTEFIRSHIGADVDSLTALERLWITRAEQYDEPFTLDREEYFENRPGHLPWKRLIVRFMQHFRETSDPLHDILMNTEGTVPAILSVTMTFGEYFKNVGSIIRNVVIYCTQCGKKLRIPRGRNLRVTCPGCRHQFTYPV